MTDRTESPLSHYSDETPSSYTSNPDTSVLPGFSANSPGIVPRNISSPSPSSPSAAVAASNTSSLPQWHTSALPFMVVVRDSTGNGNPNTGAHSIPQAPPHTHSSVDRSLSASPLKPQSPGLPQSSYSGSSSTTTANNSNNHYRTIYPEIRYVFSDDDFVPTIDVLDAQQEDASVIIDFDSTGTKVVGSQSLSPAWQIISVSSPSLLSPSPSSPSLSASSSMLSPGSRNVKNKVRQTQPPVWAEQAVETDSVAHILYLDGLPVVTRSNKPDTTTTTNKTKNPKSTTNDINTTDIQSMIRRFQETNGQIRQIISANTEEIKESKKERKEL